MRCLIALLLLVSGSCALAQDALLRNPSFEEAADAPDRAAHWNRWGDWLNREDSWTPAHSGKCLIGYHHWRIEKDQNAGLWQDAKVSPRTPYTFRIYANCDRPQGSNHAAIIELALEATVDGKQMVLVTRSYPVSDLASGNDWSHLAITASSPNDTIRVLIRITPATNAPRGGAVKLDDASLAPAKR